MNPPSPGRFGAAGQRAMLFGFAFLARAIYLLIYRPSLESYYMGLADSLLRSGVFGYDGTPSTAFEPAYPLFLAGARLIARDSDISIQLLQVAVTSIGAVLVHDVAVRLTASPPTATLAGVLFALHPLLVRQSSAASDLALATTLVAGFASAFVRIHRPRDAVRAGLVLGLAVLTRSMILPVLGFSVVILMLRREWRQSIALALGALTLIAPMLARNYTIAGTLLPTRSGVNLYIGNSSLTAQLFPTHDLDLLEADAYEQFVRARPDAVGDSIESEVAFDQFLTERAIDHMRRDPVRTIVQKIVNVWHLVSPRIVPYRISGRDTRVHIDDNGSARVIDSLARSRIEVWAHGIAASLLLPGTVAGILYRRRQLGDDAVLWAVAVTFLTVNAVYVPATRYMSPMLFVPIFYTATALVAFGRPSEN